MTTILALDIATNLGWAFGSDTVEAPSFGSIQLGKDGASHAARFGAALRWAVNELKSHPPDIIAIELALKVQAFNKKNHASAVLQFGYHAIVRAVAFECSIFNVQEYDVAEVRNLFLGYSHLSRDVAKAAAVKRCHQLGWKVTNDDQADACAIWMYQRYQSYKKPVHDQLAKCGIVTITVPKRGALKLPKKLRFREHLTK